MTQPVTTDQLTATQYVVPVQQLQSLPKLAKATAPVTPPETSPKQPHNWTGLIFVALVWTAVVALAFDLIYGGADVRAVQAQASAAQRETAQLQQRINTAAAALGCPAGGYGQ